VIVADEGRAVLTAFVAMDEVSTGLKTDVNEK
jgi:hypothetical protein